MNSFVLNLVSKYTNNKIKIGQFHFKTSAHFSISPTISLKFCEISDFKTTKKSGCNLYSAFLFCKISKILSYSITLISTNSANVPPSPPEKKDVSKLLIVIKTL